MSRRDQTRRTLIAYDIQDDRRRVRAAKVLEEYGDRIQYSVFVVDLLPASLVSLRQKLRSLIEPADDSVLICDLGLHSSLTDEQFSFIGQKREITEEGPFII